MARKALVFFPHNPYPPRSGAHRRCMSMLRALQAIGYEITLLSSAQFTDSPWMPESITYLQDECGFTVKVHEPTEFDHRYTAYFQAKQSYGISFARYTPPGLRAEFQSLFRRLSPDLVLVNYALWGGLAIGAAYRSVLTMIDTIDLYSRNLKMNDALNPYLRAFPLHPKDVDPLFVSEDFFSHFEVEAAPEEYWIYSQYDYTIAISPGEARAMRQNTQTTTIAYLPMTLDVPSIQNSYTHAPLFAIGPNPFNLQGYCYFAQRVLPLILEKFPEFKLRLVGPGCQNLVAVAGTELLGFIPDLTSLYAESCFAICPLIGGTGQQVKIVEAMAHGVPVIALKNLAESSPIESGVNGFIAEDAEEFAGYAVQLLQDQDLCRRLGEAARATITRTFLEQRLVEQLTRMVDQASAVLAQRPANVLPTIVVDGVCFQNLSSPRRHFWEGLLQEWSKTDCAEHIVLLDRDETAPRLAGLRYRLIHPYHPDQAALDAEMLQAACEQESADVFISTGYTTPTSTPSVCMVYDRVPEPLRLTGDDSTDPEERWSILHASHYITNSAQTAEKVMQAFPQIQVDQISVVDHGADRLSSWPRTAQLIADALTKMAQDYPGDRANQTGLVWSELRQFQEQSAVALAENQAQCQSLQQQVESATEQLHASHQHVQVLQQQFEQQLESATEQLESATEQLHASHQHARLLQQQFEQQLQSAIEQIRTSQRYAYSLEHRLEELHQQSQATQQQLLDRIAGMESSKFWKLRNAWLKFKQFIRFPQVNRPRVG
jgi:glycosyltransferase involved in cell wall biosynthesis